VRTWIEGFLPACAPLDDLVVIASELATNAVEHTRSGDPGGRFTVDVTWSPDSARVVVGDQGSDEVPESAASLEEEFACAESGRGLWLVGQLSAAWGSAGDSEARWLWADLHWLSRGGPLPTMACGNRAAEFELTELSRAYPGTLAWYDERSHDWCAALPRSQATEDILCAPSFTALGRMLAARYLATTPL
jgi:serine/threonine-protein kinase RsbW